MIVKIIDFFKKLSQHRTFKIAFSIGAILFTIGILISLVYNEWDILTSYIIKFRPKALISSFLIYSLILLLTSIVWSDIMNNIGFKTSFNKHFTNFCLSALGKRLPGTFWYVAWRTNLYREIGYSSKFIIFTSGIEIVIIVISAGLVSLFFSLSLISQYQYSIIGFILVIIGSVLFFHPKIKKYISTKFHLDLSRFRIIDILKWVFYYFFIWLLIGILMFSIGNIFYKFDLSYLSYFIGASSLIGVLSRLFLFLPSYFGFREISLSLLLSGIMPSSLAVVIALSNRIIIISFEIIWALLALLIQRVFKQNNPKEL